MSEGKHAGESLATCRNKVFWIQTGINAAKTVHNFSPQRDAQYSEPFFRQSPLSVVGYE